ncbi:DUF6377 domain-containing protein [Parabacteroides sp. FAFU027]|uniref:DUF6377 domain-containing protein n=1 Tax=Parabacteroides sp. FAFU027 TaxID=2922715 RepID=UPI001FAFDC6B|nr:DUF6377 domain-containing protein [Parabacteroides sp. FAFU027]
MRLLTFAVLLLFVSTLYANTEVVSLLKELDQTLTERSLYTDIKEKKLQLLKTQLRNATDDNVHYVVCGLLFDEYKTYLADSSLEYARMKLRIAEKQHNVFRINESRLDIAYFFSVVGRAKLSLDMLNQVDIDDYPELKGYYHLILRYVYGNLLSYAIDKDEKQRFNSEINRCCEYMLKCPSDRIPGVNIIRSDQLINNRAYTKALKILLPAYSSLPDNHNRALYAYFIAMAYQGLGDRLHEKRWLAISSIYDLKYAYRNYESLYKLAFLLFEEGDINRSHRYILRSLDDALLCKSRARTWEITQIMPIINQAYESANRDRQQLLGVFAGVIVLLLFILLVSRSKMRKHMRQLDIMQKERDLAYEQLKYLNQQLVSANEMLKQTNNDLTEASLIKEEFVGRYIEQCSLYIQKLDEYRRELHKIAMTGKMEDLMRNIRSEKFINEELVTFYTNFDQTFLQLFPNFIEEFNALLQNDYAIHPKPGEGLPTELRMMALIRLGITDSVKMSQFLRYSVTTIYNYRTRIRNKAAIPRDTFEDEVMKIGIKKPEWHKLN